MRIILSCLLLVCMSLTAFTQKVVVTVKVNKDTVAILVDGKKAGIAHTQKSLVLNLSPGKYVISATKFDFEQKNREVNLISGQNEEVNFHFTNNNVMFKPPVIVQEQDDVASVSVVEVVQEIEHQETPTVFMIVEQMPEFPGGHDAAVKYIQKNAVYPDSARKNGIIGRVFVRFIVNNIGMVTNVEVIRGVYPSLDAEAVRVIKSMPLWKPGKQRNKAVDVQMTFPVDFKLK